MVAVTRQPKRMLFKFIAAIRMYSSVMERSNSVNVEETMKKKKKNFKKRTKIKLLQLTRVDRNEPEHRGASGAALSLLVIGTRRGEPMPQS